MLLQITACVQVGDFGFRIDHTHLRFASLCAALTVCIELFRRLKAEE